MSLLGDLSGKGQSDRSRAEQGYSTGYSTWSPGLDYSHLSGRTNLEQGTIAGYQAAEGAYDSRNAMEAQWAAFFDSLGGGGSGPKEPSGPSYEEQQADYDARQAEIARQQGIAERDTAFSSYLDAAGTATDYVTGEIQKEQSNANLLGIDYTMTDELKATRINDYFSTIWGEGEHTNLTGLMSKWGDPTGFTGFSITRGDGSVYASKTEGGDTLATSKGVKPPGILDDEEEVLGGFSALGGKL